MIMFRIARDFEILRFYYHIGLRDLQSMYPASNRTLTEGKAKPRGAAAGLPHQEVSTNNLKRQLRRFNAR
jgi:hypothetical protein